MRIWGPQLLGTGETRFRLWAPGVSEMVLEVEGLGAVSMSLAGDGWYELDLPVGAGARYRFHPQAGDPVPDPASRLQSGGVHGWSVVVDPEAYSWRETNWRGRSWRDAIIMEIHAGVLGGFAGVMRRLEEIAGLGITAIQLMPVNAFGGARNWGYDGVLPYAPAECYGTPVELKALVDQAHALGLMIFLDVVYNHFGPDGNYLGVYADGFFHDDIDTPWGGAIAVDQPAVGRFFIDNALMWVREYRFDGLRFDAVHAIANDGFLDAMATEIRLATEGRHVHLVLENERNDPGRLRPGTYDAQWNDDFHNVLHVLLTGETGAYYRDFADHPAERLARCLSEGFIYQGEGSPNHDGKPRGAPSGHLPPSAFVSFLQNHDQIGNRALGERLTVLTTTPRLRAATVLLLLCPQIPLLFMGDSEGSHSPFLFFTDFHDELAEVVREGRRKEFAKFESFADPAARERIPDPNARKTFERSRPEPGPEAEAWRSLYRTLIGIRTARIAPALDGTRSEGAEAIGPAAVLARWRLGDGTRLIIAVNFGREAADWAMPSGTPVFAEGTAGAAESAVAWLEPA